MVAMFNGTQESTDVRAIIAQAENAARENAAPQETDYNGTMDFHGVVSVKRAHFDFDTRTCMVPFTKTVDGQKVSGTKQVSKKALYGVIFRKCNTVRGASLRLDGSIDYSEGLPVDVTWTVAGRMQCARFRIAYAVFNGHDAQTSTIVCSYKSKSTGAYVEKRFLTGNIVHIASAE